MPSETIHSFLTIFIPLLIILDPLGNLPLFLLFTKDNSQAEQDKMAAQATLASAAILFFFGLTGDFLLRFFGISLPAFQIAGGFIFFLYALQMLQLLPSSMKTSDQEKQEGVAKENVAFVPLATPLLAGPGSITAVLVWHQNASATNNIALLFVAIILASVVVYITFRFAKRIRDFLGIGGILVMSRLMGLLLAVIAVQFMVSGFQQIG